MGSHLLSRSIKVHLRAVLPCQRHHCRSYVILHHVDQHVLCWCYATAPFHIDVLSSWEMMSVIWSKHCGNSINSDGGDIYCIGESFCSSTLMFKHYITNGIIRKVFKFRYSMNCVPILLLQKWYIEIYRRLILVSFMGYCNPFTRLHLLYIFTSLFKPTCGSIHVHWYE